MFNVKEYIPAGPTLKRFHESSKFFRLGAGPVGSGKTAGCGCAEMVLGAMIQNPAPDGVRRAKFGVLRDTYRNLYSQFIPSWLEWFPKDLGNFVGSDDRPAMHTFGIDTPLGPCELQVEMRALGTNAVEKVCRGWNLTGCFADEADLMPEEAFNFLTGRVKRWPAAPMRVTKGVWGTFNKPDVDHWTYRWCVDDIPENFEFFDQPPGLLPGGPPYLTNPAAENMERLDADYYILQAQSNPAWYVKRMVRNEWGASVSGEIIYPEFNPDHHMLPVEIQPDPRDELTVGIDGGGTPAATISGRDRAGRKIVYAEVVLSDPYDPKGRRLVTGVGPRRFAEALGDLLRTRFRTNRVRIAYGDPAAFYGADREFGEFSFMETVGQITKLAVQPAPSNEIDLRLEAVRQPLTSWRDGAPMLRINPSCKWLRAGFTSDYKYEERDPKAPGKRLKPQKTRTSHVHDALQYDCLGDFGRSSTTGGLQFDRYNPTQHDRTSNIEPIWKTIEAQQRNNTGHQPGDGQSYNSDFDLWKS